MWTNLVIFYFMNWNIIKQLIIVSGNYLKIIYRPSISWSLSYSHLLLPLSFMAIKPRQLIAWIFFGNFKQQVSICINKVKVAWNRSHHPSPSVKIQIMGRNVCLSCKGKTLLGIVNKLLKTKQKNVDITQQCFALLPQVNFPTNDLNEMKVIGSNPGYLLKSFLL